MLDARRQHPVKDQRHQRAKAEKDQAAVKHPALSRTRRDRFRCGYIDGQQYYADAALLHPCYRTHVWKGERADDVLAVWR